MKKEKEIYNKIIELKLEAKSIKKVINNPKTDYDVWKSLDVDLTECNHKIEILEWVVIKD